MENVNTAVAPVSGGRETIKEKDLLAKILTGSEPILVGEYRSQKVEAIKYLDKQTNKESVFLKVTANVEVGSDCAPVSVEVRMPRGLTDPASVSLGLSKGNRVAVRLAKLVTEKGVTSASVAGPESLLIVV